MSRKGIPNKRRKARSAELALATTTEPLVGTQKAIEERRARVFELHFVRDYSPRVVAASLGVSHQTIYDDLRALQDALSDQMRRTDSIGLVGLRQAVYKKLLGRAFQGMDETKNHRTKNLYLLSALKVQNALVTFESGIGLIPSKTAKIDLRIRRNVSDEIDDPEFAEAIENPDSRRKIVQFFEKFSQVAGDEPDVQFPFADVPKAADVVSVSTTPASAAPPAVDKAKQNEAIEKAKQAVTPPPPPKVRREPG